MHKKLLLPSQLNLSSFSSGCRASFESNCLLISLSSDSLYSLIFKIAIALTPPTAKKNTARKYWSERNAISPNSFSSRQIAPRALPVKHNRQAPAQVSPQLVLKVFISHQWVTAIINNSLLSRLFFHDVIYSPKPQSQVWILIYRKWPIYHIRPKV